MVDLVSAKKIRRRRNSEYSAWPWTFLKGKEEVISVIDGDEGSVPSPPSTVCILVILVIFLYVLSYLHSFVHKITEGKTGEEIWSSVTYSSFSLLWPMERTNTLGKVLCDQKIWKMCLGQRWEEHGEGGGGCLWLKISDKTKEPPAKSCLQYQKSKS